MRAAVRYALPRSASQRIEPLLDSIERRANVAVEPRELENIHERLNVRDVVADLPEGLSEEDFVGILKLAMLTECATDSYAAVFYEGAEEHNAPWLKRFTERTWVPDEYTHTAPFKAMLMSMDFSEEELDAEIARVQGATYVHACGRTPVELTTFGMIQEYLTDHWHGLIAKLLRNRAPVAADLATRVKRRETLHYVWYQRMSAAQVEANPELVSLVADTVSTFNMPGVSLVPEYQLRALEWLPPMGADLQRNARAIIRSLYEVAGNTRRAGEILMDVAVLRGIPIAKLSPERVQGLIERLGGRGYSLLGEAVLDSVGLPLPADVGRHASDKYVGAIPTLAALQDRLRAKVRALIARRIDISSISKA